MEAEVLKEPDTHNVKPQIHDLNGIKWVWFGRWLPLSEYERAHGQILDEHYDAQQTNAKEKNGCR